jgi:hypothetical protein
MRSLTMREHTPFGRTDRTEAGLVALMTVATVCTVTAVVVAVLVQVSSVDQTTTELTAQQAQALNAAEGGIDLSVAEMQGVSISALPCGPGALTAKLPTAPEGSQYTANISYYSTFPPSGAALSCSQVQSGSAVPQAAEVTSTGTDARVAQYMESLVKITVAQAGASVFDQAVFVQGSASFSNDFNLDDSSGQDSANMYTNGSLTCSNSSAIQGNITVQGSFTGSNACSVSGNLTAVDNIALQNSATVAGSAYSTGNSGCGTGSTEGNISLTNNALIDQSAYAYCSITVKNSATVKGTSVDPDAALNNPSPETFPTLTYSASAWSAAGYTAVTNNTCSGSGSVYNTISAMSSAATPTVVVTSCALSWTNSNSISLNQNLAIFSTGGFSMANSTSWNTVGSGTHDLYLIVPSTVTCSNGSPGISLKNSTQFATSLDVLFYTPCQFSATNDSGVMGQGQVYAGTWSQGNEFNLNYTAVPTAPGATGGPSSSGQSATTTVAVVYERQLSSLSLG